VITFRSNYAGAQDWYKVGPGLTAMGKMIGGDFPVGALAGRGEVMDVMDQLADKVLFPHSGTFSTNPITITAGLVTMEMFDEAAVSKLNVLAEYARSQLEEATRVSDIPACVTGGGPMLRVQMKPEPPVNYRAAFATPGETARLKVLLVHLFDNGIMMINTCSGTLSTVMTEKEVDILADVILGGFGKIKELLSKDNNA